MAAKTSGPKLIEPASLTPNPRATSFTSTSLCTRTGSILMIPIGSTIATAGQFIKMSALTPKEWGSTLRNLASLGSVAMNNIRYVRHILRKL